MEKFISRYTESNKVKILKTSKYWVYTDNGKMLDLQMGNTAFIFGYDDQELIDATNSTNTRFVRNGEFETSEKIFKVVTRLLKMSKMSALSWSVSGTDAVETALAIGELYWLNIDNERNKIVSLTPCYHGASWLTRSLRGSVQNSLCKYVQSPQWTYIFDRESQEQITLNQIKEHFSKGDVGRIIIESIPWINGVQPFSEVFWKSVSSLCKEYQVLLILDDVAGCFGKVGKPFSNITLDIDADIIALGKSVTGGYSPIGVTLVNGKVFDIVSDSFWTHTYTYNPNTVAINAIDKVLDKIEHGVFNRIEKIGSEFETILNEHNLPYRNQGLVFDLYSNTDINFSKFRKAGFAFNIYGAKSLPIIVPLIADDDYYNTFKNQLKIAYDF